MISRILKKLYCSIYYKISGFALRFDYVRKSIIILYSTDDCFLYVLAYTIINLHVILYEILVLSMCKKKK